MKKHQLANARTAEGAARRFGVGMISPTILVLLVMTAYPLLFTLFYSFTDFNLLRNLQKPASFIALGNYTKLLSDAYFRQAILNTVKFTLLAV